MSEEDIDELFSDWFWYFLGCGYTRENAIRMAARRVMSFLQAGASC